MRRFDILGLVKHLWALWTFRRNRNNPQFILSLVPGGTTMYLYVNDGFLSSPQAGGAYLKRPIAIRDEDGTRLISRLGLYRMGKYWLRVYGRYNTHEVTACEKCEQAAVEPCRLCEILCPKRPVRQPCPA